MSNTLTKLPIIFCCTLLAAACHTKTVRIPTPGTGGSGGSGDTAELERLRNQVNTLQGERDNLQGELDQVTITFGEALQARGNPEGASIVSTRRRTGVAINFRGTFDPTGNYSQASAYDVMNYGTVNPNRLSIPTTTIPYTDGKTVVSSSPATDEFPGRGTVFRGETRRDSPNRIVVVQGRSLASGWDNADAETRSSFQFREQGGLTMKFGGAPDEGLIYGDLEVYAAKGGNTCGTGGASPCDEAVTNDVTVSFGSPSADPYGEQAYYWSLDVPNPRLDATGNAVTSLTPNRYETLLSNYASADGGTTDTYLAYAAYGLHRAVDYQTSSPRTGRMYTFHYGLDAYGTHRAVPSASESTIVANFKGRTMGWMGHPANRNVGHMGRNFIGSLTRIRGDVTLTANIGGNAANANQIRGAIHDLEYALGVGGGWVWGNGLHPNGGGAFAGDILLRGTLDSNGAYTGTAAPDSMPSNQAAFTVRRPNFPTEPMDRYWFNGEFEGVLYGPPNALETAGSWYVPSVGAESHHATGMYGSFGAKVTP